MLNDNLVFVLIDLQLVDEQNFQVVQNDHMMIHLDFHYLNKNLIKKKREKNIFLRSITSACRNVCKSSTIGV